VGKRNLHWLAAVLLSLGLCAGAAAASELDQAKLAGHVGEQIDGYLGVVAGAPASAKSLVERINQGRRAKYAEIAKSNGVSVEVVAAQAGAKLVARASAGEYVRDASGWRKK
jgi:uncharacterized protein YdbL (DUF1318 family)